MVCFYNCHRAGHARKQFGGFRVVGRVGDSDVCTRENKLVLAINIVELHLVLNDQVILDPIACGVAHRVHDVVHAAQRGELVNQSQQPVLVRLHRAAILKLHALG